MTINTKTLLAAALPLLLTCCTADGPKYRIGVSQCVGGKWRDKANNEMLSAQHLYDTDVTVTIANADNDTRRQCRQIDSLVGAGVDLLVVSPNDDRALDASLRNASRRNIPIVFYDRTTTFAGYTAYIGGDNRDAGRQMARYAAKLCRDSVNATGRKPLVLELTGALRLSPDRQRHEGFAGVMRQCGDIEYATRATDWTYDGTKVAMQQWLRSRRKPDVVFCHSDNAALGARAAAAEAGELHGMHFLGIDALPGSGGGIEAVQKGTLAASYIYPTSGEEVVALALHILEGKPFSRDNTLHSFVVTPQNVSETALSSNALLRQNQYLATIQSKLESYLGVYHVQRTLLAASALLILMLAIAVAATWRAVRATRRANRRMRSLNDEQTRFFVNASHQLRTPLTLIAGPVGQLAEGKGDSRQLIAIVQRNVEQLQRLVADVLLFRRDNSSTVDDTTAATGEQLSASAKAVRDSRHDTVVNANTDELATVLIVDDNADMRAYLRTLLLDRYYVIEASDGQSGLRLAVESIPDIVVSDVMMPVMNGLTFCTRLKQNAATSHIPVLLLTARSTEQQHIEGLQTGADAYMTKPFSAHLLLASIATLLNNRQLLRLRFAAADDGHGEPDTPTASPDRRFLDAFTQALEKRMSDPKLKIEDIGDEVGLSRVQLYRKVKALTGKTPVEILRETRLNKAHRLLLATDKTVAEVAYEVGFATPGYFSACFKKQFGQYPTDLREGQNTV